MNATAPDIITVLYGIKADSYVISRTRDGFPVREIVERRDAFTVREMKYESGFRIACRTTVR